MQESRPHLCTHEGVVVDPGLPLDRRFFCEDCGHYVQGEELPEGRLRDYWRAAKEAWGGR